MVSNPFTMEDVTDLFEVPSIFDEDARQELREFAATSLTDHLTTHVLQLLYPDFVDKVCEDLIDLLLINVDHLAPLFDVETELREIVQEALQQVYQLALPPRAYNHSFLRHRQTSRAKLEAQLTFLQQVPQPAQRSAEWYAFRANVLTASNIWKAFFSESSRNQLIFEKCKPFNAEKYNFTSTESAMHWGQRYEPVSVQLYEELYKTKVGDFGCIPHKTLAFLAASPDGINVDASSPRFGRMLEIKNIVNREITGIPKMEYWVQMQVQMEVCELNECDFLETRFKEYENLEQFEGDSPEDAPTSFALTRSGQAKGVIVYFIENGQPKYVYAPRDVLLTKASFDAWEEALLEAHSHLTWMTNLYWRLDQLSCVLVLRNKAWFQAATPILLDVWDTIVREKVEGYEHRAPQSRTRTTSAATAAMADTNANPFQGQCFLRVLKLDAEEDEPMLAVD
jgi:putative phage-type endonuclease